MVVEVHVDVANNVLDLYDAALEVDTGDGLAEHGNDLVRGEDAEEEVSTTRQDHFPRREEEDGAVGVEEADGDGGEFLLFEGAVGEDAVDELEVEGEAAAEDLGGADHVVHHDEGLVRHAVCVVTMRVVQVDVPGDAVICHGRILCGPTAAAHVEGEYVWWKTRAKVLLKRKDRYKRGNGWRDVCVSGSSAEWIKRY